MNLKTWMIWLFIGDCKNKWYRWGEMWVRPLLGCVNKSKKEGHERKEKWTWKGKKDTITFIITFFSVHPGTH